MSTPTATRDAPVGVLDDVVLRVVDDAQQEPYAHEVPTRRYVACDYRLPPLSAPHLAAPSATIADLASRELQFGALLRLLALRNTASTYAETSPTVRSSRRVYRSFWRSIAGRLLRAGIAEHPSPQLTEAFDAARQRHLEVSRRVLALTSGVEKGTSRQLVCYVSRVDDQGLANRFLAAYVQAIAGARDIGPHVVIDESSGVVMISSPAKRLGSRTYVELAIGSQRAGSTALKSFLDGLRPETAKEQVTLVDFSTEASTSENSVSRSLRRQIDDVTAYEVAWGVVSTWIAEVAASHAENAASRDGQSARVTRIKKFVAMRDSLSTGDRKTLDVVAALGATTVADSPDFA